MTALVRTPTGTLVELLEDTADADTTPAEWRRHVRNVAWPLAVTVASIAAWSATAPLTSAVVAPAQLQVELNRKTVQHHEGGIVREIRVRDGQRVRAGDPLLVVGDVRQEAELELLLDQARAARVRVARAEAQARLAVRFQPAADLQREAPDHVAREHALFDAQRRALDEQTALLGAQIREAQAQAAALQSQIEATGESTRLADGELVLNEDLAKQGFVSRARLMTLQRTSADYRSRVGEQRGDLAAARQRVAELNARVAQLRIAMQTQATDELKEATARVREIEERLRPSRDSVERQIVRSPVDGEVMGLRVAAVGAAIAPREALLEVVPSREKLVVQAHIPPHEIEHVHAGAAAEVRLVGSDTRREAPLPARVVFVSADRVREPETGRSWFDVTVEVDVGTLQETRPSLQLRSGMPAELYVATGRRTLFEYLAAPLGLFMRRAMREA